MESQTQHNKPWVMPAPATELAALNTPEIRAIVGDKARGTRLVEMLLTEAGRMVQEREFAAHQFETRKAS